MKRNSKPKNVKGKRKRKMHSEKIKAKMKFMVMTFEMTHVGLI